MENLEKRFIMSIIMVMIFVIMIIIDVFFYKKNKTNRRKDLKKERRECIYNVVVGVILVIFFGWNSVTSSLDLKYQDFETKTLALSSIRNGVKGAGFIHGVRLNFENDFTCYTYTGVINYDFLRGNEGKRYTVTYSKRAHMLISIEEALPLQ